jgi:glycolate oxidase FAD binding subunit
VSIAAGATSIMRDVAAMVGDAFCVPASADSDALRVTPANPDEIAAVLRLASERKLAVVIEGGGVQRDGGEPSRRADLFLSTSRLKDVEHFDPGDLTLGVGAGTTLADIDAMVAPHKLFLPITTLPATSRSDRATIGSVLATAAHGPLRHGFGGVREFCIGIRFVTGDGKFAKGGGRVVKNVAGYDLMKLLIGSHGTLGLITSASFKVFPRAQQTRTFVASFENHKDAIAFRDRVMRSPLSPLCLELVSPGFAIGVADVQGWRVLVRAAGSDGVLGRYRRELGSSVATDIYGAAEERAWIAITDFDEIISRQPGALRVQAAFLASAADEVLASAIRAAKENGFDLHAIGRLAIAAMQVAFVPRSASASADDYINVLNSMRSVAAKAELKTNIRAFPDSLPASVACWSPIPETTHDCMRLIKRALDPAGVLNSGRFLV